MQGKSFYRPSVEWKKTRLGAGHYVLTSFLSALCGVETTANILQHAMYRMFLSALCGVETK
ncbi:MAG: hypothetical protein N3E49_09660 [Bacteroidia bacterium]|nr:hypothetical protein [Bacteroidia bacterium]